MVFADKRYARADKRAKLPKWINQYITDTAANLSTDMAVVLSKLFMRTISQTSNDNQTGISLWTIDDVKAAQEKQRQLLDAQEQASGQDGDVEMDDGIGDSDEYGDGGIPDEILQTMDIEQ